jgi:anti-anti-sigma factor
MTNQHHDGASNSTPSTIDLQLTGDVRADQVACLHEKLVALSQDQRATLTIDCSQLSSLDGAVFQLLAFWKTECTRRGRRLVLSCLPSPVGELLHSNGLAGQ